MAALTGIGGQAALWLAERTGWQARWGWLEVLPLLLGVVVPHALYAISQALGPRDARARLAPGAGSDRWVLVFVLTQVGCLVPALTHGARFPAPRLLALPLFAASLVLLLLHVRRRRLAP